MEQAQQMHQEAYGQCSGFHRRENAYLTLTSLRPSGEDQQQMDQEQQAPPPPTGSAFPLTPFLSLPRKSSLLTSPVSLSAASFTYKTLYPRYPLPLKPFCFV